MAWPPAPKPGHKKNKPLQESLPSRRGKARMGGTSAATAPSLTTVVILPTSVVILSEAEESKISISRLPSATTIRSGIKAAGFHRLQEDMNFVPDICSAAGLPQRDCRLQTPTVSHQTDQNGPKWCGNKTSPLSLRQRGLPGKAHDTCQGNRVLETISNYSGSIDGGTR